MAAGVWGAPLCAFCGAGFCADTSAARTEIKRKAHVASLAGLRGMNAAILAQTPVVGRCVQIALCRPSGTRASILIRTQDFRPGLYYDAPAGLSYCPGSNLFNAAAKRIGPSTRSLFRCVQLALAQDDIRISGETHRSFDSRLFRCAQLTLAQDDIGLSECVEAGLHP